MLLKRPGSAARDRELVRPACLMPCVLQGVDSFTISVPGLRCRRGLYVCAMNMVGIISAALRQPRSAAIRPRPDPARANEWLVPFSPPPSLAQMVCKRIPSARISSFDARLHLHPEPVRGDPHRSGLYQRSEAHALSEALSRKVAIAPIRSKASYYTDPFGQPQWRASHGPSVLPALVCVKAPTEPALTHIIHSSYPSLHPRRPPCWCW